MNLSITIPAMVNNTALPSLPNASTERPPTGSPNRWNETRQASEAVDCKPDWSVPIKAMMKSLPLWAIIVSHFSEYWYFYILMGYTPTYINSVLQISLTNSGYLSALMLGVTFICTFLGGLLADFLLSRKLLRLILIRKLFTAVGKDRGGAGDGGERGAASSSLCVSPLPGVLLPTVFSVSLSWVTSSFSTTIAFLALCFAAGSLCQTGALLNFLDIAPR
uniref:Solute carrier family 17 member 4 n=1 Tax=Rhinolophus ferrumequinum TaxID=59479 RepID=A0A671FFU6_RHIFE